MSTEQLLFALCALLALTPLLLLTLVLNRLSGEGTFRAELGERGVRQAKEERDEARWEAQRLREKLTLETVTPVTVVPPVTPPSTPWAYSTVEHTGSVVEETPVRLDSPSGSDLGTPRAVVPK